MASIDSLPAPLPLYIIKLLPDLKALDALRRSSAVFAAVFELHVVEILEHLMTSTLRSDTILVIRAHILCLADRSKWRRTEKAMDELQALAKASLNTHVPFEAISLALRSYSSFHSLSHHVATEKLDELYSLPYCRAERSLVNPGDFKRVEAIEYQVPAPAPLYWIEEQRILLALFHLRTEAMLSQYTTTLDPPPNPSSVASFSFVREGRHFFDAHIHIVINKAINDCPNWQAQASFPAQDSEAGQPWAAYEAAETAVLPAGWHLFHKRHHMPRPTSFDGSRWPFLQDLGFGFWSRRRLAQDLQLTSLPMTVVKSREREGRIDLGQDLCGLRLTFTWWILCKALVPEKTLGESNAFEHPAVSRSE